jgi:phytoene dehydrogenase-like protein
MGAAHAYGWPLVRGGAQQLANGLHSIFQSQGGTSVVSSPVANLRELPTSRVVLFNTSARDFGRIAAEDLPVGYRRSLAAFRYGPGVCKVDWALDAPIPWQAAEVKRAGTVHLGGTVDEIAASERAPWRGQHAERPHVILVQPTLFDASRAPSGKHVAWAYCHVPHGSDTDLSERIEAQVERFAPGFRNRILARHVMTAKDMAQHNPNYVGGDINSGVMDLGQFFTRPVVRLVPYATPNRRLFLCSSATPPGGSVHGMCGYHAAGVALRRAVAQS